MEKEEGEMSDDNAMIIDDVKEPIVTEKESDCALLYKAEKDGIVVERLQKIDAAKLEDRAKRFGINLTGNRLVTQTQIDELYANSGIESGNERHFRFDALHLNGVDGLTTREIFEYLEDYKPVSLEWVDDLSCNIVCKDHITAALALLVHSREIKNDDLKQMLSTKVHYYWREGMPHEKKDLILMRFATNADKKVSNKKKSECKESKHSDEYYDQSMDSVSKNPWGDLCKSWGVYDHKEVVQRVLPKNDYEDEIDEQPRQIVQIKNKRLAMRLGRRRRNTVETEDSSSDSEWKKKSKTPRMRMHADDEESKQKKKQALELSREIDRPRDEEQDTYAPLSIEVVNSQSIYKPRETTKLSDKFKKHDRNRNTKKHSIQSRLGIKVVPVEEKEVWSSDSGSSDDSDYNIMSRVQKVSAAAKTTSSASVWSRLEAKQKSKDSTQSDLRQILKSRKEKKSDGDDLRGRISNSKKSNLRIEIDNNYAK